MRNSSDPAFPVDGIHASDALKHYTSGLTKREYFAALAMQGAITRYSNTGDIARIAIKCADELLKQLDQ